MTIEQHTSIESLRGAALRAKFREVVGAETKSNNRPYLIKRIAEALKAQSAKTGAEAKGSEKSAMPRRRKREEKKRDSRLPPVGTVLERTYQGETFRAKVLDDGFEFRGQKYRSLSALAKEIEVGWSQFPCTTNSVDCVSFTDLKSAHFSTWLPERRPYFHYAVWAYRLANTNIGGLGEQPGNDIVLALGGGDVPTDRQRAIFMHEFGHNLGLKHNGNDHPTDNSVVHASVMNYRYATAGVPGAGTTYSDGMGSCAPCTSSPKSSCISARTTNQCAAYPNCDCDVNEWGSLNFAFINSTQGQSGPVLISGYDNAPAESGEPPGKSRDQHRPLHERERLAYKVPHSVKVKRAAEEIKRLEQQGLRRGVDFSVAPDQSAVFPMCK